MPVKNYSFSIEGSAARGQTWTAAGTVIGLSPQDAFANAMLESFQQLTNGKAVFGQPGLGCNGPYQIDKVVIALTKG